MQETSCSVLAEVKPVSSAKMGYTYGGGEIVTHVMTLIFILVVMVPILKHAAQCSYGNYGVPEIKSSLSHKVPSMLSCVRAIMSMWLRASLASSCINWSLRCSASAASIRWSYSCSNLSAAWLICQQKLILVQSKLSISVLNRRCQGLDKFKATPNGHGQDCHLWSDESSRFLFKRRETCCFAQTMYFAGNHSLANQDTMQYKPFVFPPLVWDHEASVQVVCSHSAVWPAWAMHVHAQHHLASVWAQPAVGRQHPCSGCQPLLIPPAFSDNYNRTSRLVRNSILGTFQTKFRLKEVSIFFVELLLSKKYISTICTVAVWSLTCRVKSIIWDSLYFQVFSRKTDSLLFVPSVYSTYPPNV